MWWNLHLLLLAVLAWPPLWSRGTCKCSVWVWHKRSQKNGRRSWLLKELDALLRRIMKDGKPSVEDVCRFLDLQIGDRGGGGLSLDAMKSNIMDKLIRDLPDSNAAASAPGISFVVALFCFWTLAVYIGMCYYIIYVFCFLFCYFLMRPLVAVWMWMCVKGDGGDGSVSVSTYVEQLRTDLIQQAVDERRSWLESQFKGLLHRKTKNGKPSVVDIARFLEFPIAHPQGGWIGKEDLTPNIIETLIGDLPDSSAAAPAMGFVSQQCDGCLPRGWGMDGSRPFLVHKHLLLWKESPRYQGFCNLRCLMGNRACSSGRRPKVELKSLCWRKGFFVSRHQTLRSTKRRCKQCTKPCRVTRSNQWRPNDRPRRWLRRRHPKSLRQPSWTSDVGIFVLVSKICVSCRPCFVFKMLSAVKTYVSCLAAQLLGRWQTCFAGPKKKCVDPADLLPCLQWNESLFFFLSIDLLDLILRCCHAGTYGVRRHRARRTRCLCAKEPERALSAMKLRPWCNGNCDP